MNVYTYYKMVVYCMLSYTFICIAEPDCGTIKTNTKNILQSNEKTNIRLMQYNTEWLFVDYYASSDCPGQGCTWKNKSEAVEHLSYVAKVIQNLQPDIVNICEIEGCDELNLLSKNTEYSPYLINGKDTSTGQNVGILTKIQPHVSLYRTEEHVNYPIINSKCGYTGAPGTAGVSKHYITEFTLNNMNIAFIGAHLLAFPTDSMRCAEREAQATVLQNVILSYIKKNYEIIMLGDFNDFDETTLDRNNNKPTSHVLDILKGANTGVYTLQNAASLMPQSSRYSDWYDSNKDCKSTLSEFSMIDHILLTPNLMDKVKNVFIYQEYAEYCGKYNSDHYPVIVDFAFA
jgi:exonuclease III